MTSNPKKILRAVLARTNTLLRPEGYNRKGMTFVKTQPEVLLILNFQRRQSEGPGDVTFTINLGALSERLHSFWWGNLAVKRDVWAANIHSRIGRLLPVKDDHWWCITESSSETTIHRCRLS